MLADKDRVPADTSRVNLAEEWELRWWCDRFSCTESALRRAVAAAGPTAATVELNLGAAAKQALGNTGED